MPFEFQNLVYIARYPTRVTLNASISAPAAPVSTRFAITFPPTANLSDRYCDVDTGSGHANGDGQRVKQLHDDGSQTAYISGLYELGSACVPASWTNAVNVATSGNVVRSTSGVLLLALGLRGIASAAPMSTALNYPAVALASKHASMRLTLGTQ